MSSQIGEDHGVMMWQEKQGSAVTNCHICMMNNVEGFQTQTHDPLLSKPAPICAGAGFDGNTLKNPRVARGIPYVVDVLYVCHLDHTGAAQITDFEVAQELLYHGIQFSTLLPICPLPVLMTPPIAVPVHLAGYKFMIEDYYAYEQQCAALLSETHVAQAALLHGGIVWRLAVATLSFDDVLEGPTTATTLQ